MPQVPRQLRLGLLALIAVGVAGAFFVQPGVGTAESARNVAMTDSDFDSDCECEETGACPIPTPTFTSPAPSEPAPEPTPTFTSPAPSGPAPLPTRTFQSLAPFPSAPGPEPSATLRLVGMTAAQRIAAPRLQAIVDVDVTGFRNGQDLVSKPVNGPTPPEFKKLCPKDDVSVKVGYTTNPFQGDLITITFYDPGFWPDDCTVTIKVLDPRTGRVLETYESPSDLILTQQDRIGFKHAPARIKVEIFCG